MTGGAYNKSRDLNITMKILDSLCTIGRSRMMVTFDADGKAHFRPLTSNELFNHYRLGLTRGYKASTRPESPYFEVSNRDWGLELSA